MEVYKLLGMLFLDSIFFSGVSTFVMFLRTVESANLLQVFFITFTICAILIIGYFLYIYTAIVLDN